MPLQINQGLESCAATDWCVGLCLTVSALLPAAVVGCSVLQGTIAVGEVEILDVLPSADDTIIHIILAGVFVLVVLDVIACSLVPDGQMAMISRVDLLHHVDDLAVAGADIDPTAAGLTTVPWISTAIAGADGLVAHGAHLNQLLIVGGQDLLLGERVGVPLPRAGEQLVPVSFFVAKAHSSGCIDDVANGVDVSRCPWQGVTLEPLAMEGVCGLIMLGVLVVVLLVPGQLSDSPSIATFSQEHNSTSFVLVNAVSTISEFSPRITDLPFPLMKDPFTPFTVVSGHLVPLVPQV
mmetsp:Transcript_33179/g.51663  ORF Transcript_33179/g.51663 Transcript_33179/m.51663 type:complete len:294 (+) Transcript_33179:512-1393(+)